MSSEKRASTALNAALLAAFRDFPPVNPLEI